jgi:hypothetical protein
VNNDWCQLVPLSCPSPRCICCAIID